VGKNKVMSTTALAVGWRVFVAESGQPQPSCIAHGNRSRIVARPQ